MFSPFTFGGSFGTVGKPRTALEGTALRRTTVRVREKDAVASSTDPEVRHNFPRIGMEKKIFCISSRGLTTFDKSGTGDRPLAEGASYEQEHDSAAWQPILVSFSISHANWKDDNILRFTTRLIRSAHKQPSHRLVVFYGIATCSMPLISERTASGRVVAKF
ncbi:hypothetical protein EI94DRAFT_1705121 [Lactarius quietus]|nr:hypothetical protein EI94DRAFT_1705121 [Lactarius quietus]